MIFRRVVLLDPTYTNGYQYLGMTLSNLGRIEEAEAIYRRAIRRFPNHSNFYYNLAFLLDKQGRDQESASLYQSARQLEIEL